MTPNELAAGLGISGQTLRAFLRREYGNLASRFDTRWDLTPEQVERARSHFARRRVAPTGVAATEQPTRVREPQPSAPVSRSSQEWTDVLEAPRTRSSALNKAEIPAQPGLYAWFRDGECLYLGIAGDLRDRLTSHRSASNDLSRSTFRSWVAVHVLGLDRATTRQRPSIVTDDQARAVNAWIAACDLAWLTQATREDAAVLESSLLAEQQPLLNAK
ncbi:hypothetical protein BJY17_000750 [Agromyces hippuratus]|uniref:GIY-YIG domain-containing protein n=1 Tax=Agromyces hippuratus TaxID=286438 RepID=A0A852WVL0_9MICO|nr:hypothetical protein [Agromyces hippuratus]NYG20003.1 hypothetical protein [Agromyces hippuratus]